MEENKNSQQDLDKEVKAQTLTYITAAFGLVVGLAWNEAIISLINAIFPMGNGGLIIKFGYAIGVTILIVFVTRYLIKVSR